MINCHKCKHYYVTWDKHFPHGCRAMKFKSKQYPSAVVFASSALECLLFEEKDLFKERRDKRAPDKEEDDR
jgi:hypothetical protein